MALERTGVELVADNAKAFTDAIGNAASALTGFESVGGAAQSTFNAFDQIVTGALRHVGEIAIDALGRAATAILDLGKAAIDTNAEFERYTTQFGVLLGSADLAQERLRELAQFGLATPFELQEIIRADKILQSFGLHSAEAAETFGFAGSEIRTIAGDMAAGTGARFEEIAKYLGQFSAGQTGMVLARFEELGIVTRKELRGMGLEFDKAGALTTPVEEAFGVLLNAAKSKFGGMSEAQSKTFEGMMSNLVDFKNMAIRTIGAPIFDVTKNMLGQFMTFLGSEQVTAWIQSATKNIEDFATGLEATIKLLVSGDFEGGIFGLQEDDPFIDFLFNLREAIISTADWIRNVGIPALFAFGAWFSEVGAPIIGAFISGAWAWLSAAFTTVSGWIVSVGVPAFNALSNWFTTVGIPAFNSLSDWINNVGIPAFHTLSDWFKNTALPAIQPVIDAVLNLWKAFTEDDPKAFTKALDGLIDVLKGLWEDRLKPELIKLWDKLVTWIKDEGIPKFVDAMEDAGKWRAELVTWVDKVAPPFLKAIGELIGRGVAWLLVEGIPTLVGALITGITDLVGLSKPDMGKAGEGLADGIVK